jgi:hypothetical protein
LDGEFGSGWLSIYPLSQCGQDRAVRKFVYVGTEVREGIALLAGECFGGIEKIAPEGLQALQRKSRCALTPEQIFQAVPVFPLPDGFPSVLESERFIGALKKGLEARIGGRRGFRRMAFILLCSLFSILF